MASSERRGDERPVVLAHRLVLPEELVQQRVGWLQERPDRGDGCRQSRDLVRPHQRARHHWRASVSSTRIESSVASSVASSMPRYEPVTRIFTGT